MNYAAFVTLAIATSLVTSACKKSAPPTPPAVQVVSPPSASGPATAPGAVAPSQATPAAGAEKSEHDQQMALHYLNTALRDYSANTGKFPTSVEELYREPGLLKQRFTPPAGRKFIINPQTRAVEVR